MTKTLTEQWREGTLQEGWYYTIITGFTDKEKMMIDYFIPELNHFEIKPTRCIKEVLAPVPSYDEYNELVQKIHILNEQNTKQYNELCEEIKKNNILEKKLEIATKSLKGISLWANTGNGGEQAVKKVCKEALKEMEGVK